MSNIKQAGDIGGLSGGSIRGSVGGLRGQVGGLRDSVGSLRGHVGAVGDKRRLPTNASRGFSMELLALRPRFVELANIMMKPPAHPWECDFTGTANIRVNKGAVFSPVITSDGIRVKYILVEFETAEVAVTANGYLYLRATIADSIVITNWPDLLHNSVPTVVTVGTSTKVLSDLAVIFSADAPSAYTPADNRLVIPIAKVSLDSTIAFVDEQLLDHIPLINIDYSDYAL